MRQAIAGLVGLAPERVNVKASTGNLEGWEGAGRGHQRLGGGGRRACRGRGVTTLQLLDTLSG